MKQLAIKTQALVMVLLLCCLSAGVWMAYWLMQQTEVELRRTLELDIGAMTTASEARGHAVKLDQLTGRFLSERDSSLLMQRDEALESMKGSMEGLVSFLSEARQPQLAQDLNESYAALLAVQKDRIAMAQAAVLPPAQVQAMLEDQKSLQAMADVLGRIKDAAVADLQQSRHQIQQASRRSIMVVIGAGLAASLLVVGFLTFYIVRPVVALERQARAWDLGQPWVPLGIRASPEVLRLASCIEDMAARLNQQFEKDREMVKLKTMLISVVTHEFMNALGVIQNVADNMRDSGDNAPAGSREQFHRMIVANIRSLSAASDTLLNMAKGDSGQFKVAPRRTEFHRLLVDTLHRLEVLYERKGIEVLLDLPETPVPVLADPAALMIAVNELVSNAIQFTPDGGKIQLGMQLVPGDAGRARVYVHDSGPGMTPEQLQEVLKGPSAPTGGEAPSRQAGVGIGMVKSIVEAHGSRLEVESKPGEGSTFSFMLSVWQAEPAAV